MPDSYPLLRGMRVVRWVVVLTEADTATLNQWAINVLQADTLEAVFTG